MPQKPTAPKTGLSSLVAEWLWVHLQAWVNQGIISPEQQAAIKNLYLWPAVVEKSSSPAKPFNLIRFLEILGALLIGLGIIAFVAFNWPRLSPQAKTFLVLALVVAVHSTGFLLTRTDSTRLAGLSLAFLGNLIFGAGIWLVAQIYQLPVHFPEGMLLWALGVVPMVFLYRSELDYFLALALFAVWTFNLAWGQQVPQPIFLAVLLGLLVPLAYYLRSQLGLVFCLGIAAAWLYLNVFLWWGEGALSAFLLLPLAGYGLLLLALAPWHSRRPFWQPYAVIYRTLGALIVGALIVVQPFYGILTLQSGHPAWNSLPWAFWAVTAGLFAAAGGCYFRVSQTGPGAGDRGPESLFPYLATAAGCWFVLPYIKFSVLPSWMGAGLMAWALWRRTRSLAPWYAFLALGAVWICTLLALWDEPWWIVLLLLLYAAFFYAHGWVLRQHERAEGGRMCQALGLAVYLSVAFLMTIQAFNREFLSRRGTLPGVYDFWILFGLLLAGYAFSVWRVRSYARPAVPKGLLPEDKAILGLLGAGALTALAALKWPGLQAWFTLLSNAALIFFLVLILVTGYRRREIYLKALALVFLSLLILCRFFEMDWNLMHKSLLLVSTGVVVLLVGIFFEKNKERIAVLD